uniref:Uncharacterized protein n=1 Tax=Timspurckia oligopyrenoides TaxID=708627 RepID=A0A7S0ZDP4_9RHOD|mmetsp:Transcript_13729/g.24632  ORF Transcript_13729/g.24632 Transcript_13729/m.24632 type:complete len:192 (+) Transcript_13729:60-635(+)|eukprot:CAMPEP_0182442426 /NCGR_PEP_ID=MMETSP1172-20130603/1350_1 /TAXON_ID=708627 /ORGANISM="Timspurckia oligopyrenoides, Strain CCMP3278" /LENGTH=191 /DNA_ID=CAMNT_0024637281 /DNA_START=33 /DNA_END=608 /DNA_ORIENTATION=+
MVAGFIGGICLDGNSTQIQNRVSRSLCTSKTQSLVFSSGNKKDLIHSIDYKGRNFGVASTRLFATESDSEIAPLTEADLCGLFQLDEMEDECETCTAVVLNSDGTITLGKTDGPVPIKVEGSWKLFNGDQFILEVDRVFEGEKGVEYTVQREYAGTVTKHLTYIEIDGNIKAPFKVGYFKLFTAEDGAKSL